MWKYKTEAPSARQFLPIFCFNDLSDELKLGSVKDDLETPILYVPIEDVEYFRAGREIYKKGFLIAILDKKYDSEKESYEAFLVSKKALHLFGLVSTSDIKSDSEDEDDGSF